MFLIKEVIECRRLIFRNQIQVEDWILNYNSQFSSLLRQNHSILQILEKGNLKKDTWQPVGTQIIVTIIFTIYMKAPCTVSDPVQAPGCWFPSSLFVLSISQQYFICINKQQLMACTFLLDRISQDSFHQCVISFKASNLTKF